MSTKSPPDICPWYLTAYSWLVRDQEAIFRRPLDTSLGPLSVTHSSDRFTIGIQAARRAEKPARRGFVVGFLAGQEVLWLPETLRILREEAKGVDITISSLSSPELATALMQNRMDVALL